MMASTQITIGEENDQGVMRPKLRQFAPLLVALVGLPGRGKSLLAHRLARYLNFVGEDTKVLDISAYRRKHMEKYASHEMFRVDNLPAWKLRQKSFHEALEDAEKILNEGISIAILDGPNVSRQQRQEIYDRFYVELGYRLMFIECVCENPEMLERNFKDILNYSTDYCDMHPEQALTDLTLKMAHYRAQYESPTLGSQGDLPCPTIKLLDGGYGGVVAHGVVGVRESKILSYISTPKPTQQVFYFSRHGESEFNVLGRIGGDAPLSSRGRRYGQALAKHVNTLNVKGLQVWTSKLQRTQATAQSINALKLHLSELNELDSGECEGLSYEEVQEYHPKELARRDYDKLNYRYPAGESYRDVMRRVEPVVLQLESESNILIVSHQAVLRCILGYFLETPPDQIPYVRVPLHTIIKLTLKGYSYVMETVQMPIDLRKYASDNNIS
ncbi:6-phosphofructo-2-kinase [Carabus blaptoides fortunei]